MLHNHFFAMMSRMKNIYRWGLMRNTRRENLSEHSLEVAQIAHALAVINRKRLNGTANPQFVATVAMYHDTSEIITGDMPTPIKYYNSEIKAAYKQIEATAEKQLLDMLPEDFKEEFNDIYNPDELTHRLVKAADKLSALIKCIEELNMGNREFMVAEKTIRKAIVDMNAPEANIFLEEFIPSFELSLDEQRKDSNNEN
ncbi:MAG: 5'-deoxynucleotidase [Clostridia bacterium]|nr:5'-deoxynucleotidase [Clostridia bacterium]